VDLFLYDEDGRVLSNGGAVVCNPCHMTVGAGNRREALTVGDLDGDGRPDLVRLGFGVVVVRGDADNVNLQGFVVNQPYGRLRSVGVRLQPRGGAHPGAVRSRSTHHAVCGPRTPASPAEDLRTSRHCCHRRR
jgi:hypothetical protein